MILITGGTGHLGRDIVTTLLREGRRVRVLARRPGADPRVDWVQGDLSTGEGVEAAVQGATRIVHAATLSPIAQRGGAVRLSDMFSSPADVDVDGTARLLEAAERAEVEHFLFVSIVGLEDSSLPYSKVKLAGETLVRGSGASWSVVRAMPFFYLVAGMLRGLERWPVWPLPTSLFRPVGTIDVAERVAMMLDDDTRGVRQEIAGPEALPFSELGRQYQDALGRHRPILPLRISQRMAGTMGFTAADGAWRGRQTWREWLASESPQARSSGRPA